MYTEAVYIDKVHSQGYLNQPGIGDAAQRDAWKPVVGACHRQGTPIFMQVFHAGAVNQGNHWVAGSIAPSAVQPRDQQIDRYAGSGPFQTPRAIMRDEIHIEIMRAVRDAVPAKVPVGVRISQTKVNDLAYVWPGGVADASARSSSRRCSAPGIIVPASATSKSSTFRGSLHTNRRIQCRSWTAASSIFTTSKRARAIRSF